MVNVKNIADEADMIINERYEIDELADAAGGYFAMPSADELAYTELLFDVCDQFGIHYYSADKKARAFVEEVTRVTWAKQQEEKTGYNRVSALHLPRKREYVYASRKGFTSGWFFLEEY